MERHVSKATPVTAYERELLVILMEECGEVIQAASKLIRFGREDRPDEAKPLSNVDYFSAEVGDVKTMIQRCLDVGLLNPRAIQLGQTRKSERLDKYLQNQPDGFR